MRLIREKYEKMSLPLKASFWFAVCSVFQKGISFLATPIYTRLLSMEQYGFFSVYQSWLSILVIFSTLNLSSGVLNNVLNKCSNQESKNKVLSNFQFLEILLISIFFGVLYLVKCFFPNIISLPLNILFLMCIQILMDSAMALWTTKSKFEYNYKPVVRASILCSILTVIISLIFIRYGTVKKFSLILGVVIASLISYIWIMAANLIKGKSVNDVSLWKFAIKFNLPLIPHYLSMMILSASDKIMIEKMTNISSVASYSIAYSISSLMTIAIVSINSSLIPWTYQKLRNKEYKEMTNKINIILALVSVLCFLVILVGPEFVYIMGGKSYMDSKWVVPCVVCGIWFTLLYSVFGNVEFFFEKRYVTMISSLIGAISNIILNLIFIPIFGYVAAALTTLICYVLLAICHYFGYRKTIKQNNIKGIYDCRVFFRISVINIVLLVFAYFLYINFKIRYIVTLILVSILIVNIKKIIKIIKKYIC